MQMILIFLYQRYRCFQKFADVVDSIVEVFLDDVHGDDVIGFAGGPVGNQAN